MPNNTQEDIESLLEAQPDYNKSTDDWEVIVKYNNSLTAVEAELGVHAELLGDSYAILTLQAAQIPLLYNYPEIEYIELPKKLFLSQIGQESLAAACITPVHSGRYNLSGKGVIVGIIDSGIDYMHPEFRDANDNSRVLYFWDQLAEGTPPKGFFHGVEYTSEQLTASSALTGDYIGHGTAISGIAAGKTGAAPGASLIVVKLGEKGHKSFAKTTEIMRALKYISDKAAVLHMPVAINLSFGTNDGPHSGNSLFETYINAVSTRWKTVIVAATGNEGVGKHHFSGNMTKGQKLEASFVTTGGISSMYLTLWKNFSDTFDFELIAPGGQSTGIISPKNRFSHMALAGTDVVIYYGQPSFYNENQEIYIHISRKSDVIPPGIWRLIITGREVVQGNFHIWLPTVEEVGVDTAFTTPDPYTTLTLPSTAEKVISVGGYNAKLGSEADFSGRGYTYQNVHVKPDLTAPAVDISSARIGGGYDTFTGTSMAAPFVTGAAALMMEWGIVQKNNPFLYGQKVKAFLQKTALRNPDRTYPNPTWGYGTLCLRAAMDELYCYRPKILKSTIF